MTDSLEILEHHGVDQFKFGSRWRVVLALVNGRQFVVNGYIENDQIAKVLITRSLPYFDPINDNSIIESFVNDATVII